MPNDKEIEFLARQISAWVFGENPDADSMCLHYTKNKSGNLKTNRLKNWECQKEAAEKILLAYKECEEKLYA